MTNEQLVILLMQQRDRLITEIAILEAVLRDTTLGQYTDRRHVADFGDTCVHNTGFMGGTTQCLNDDHYAQMPNGSVICLDDLKRVGDDLETYIEVLQGQEASV